MGTVQTDVTKQLEELERKYWQAIKDNDLDEALKLSDEPCIVAGAQGVASLDKKTFEKMMKSSSWKLLDFKLADFNVRLINDDVAIVAYTVHEDMEVDGKPLSLDAADSSTWVKRNGHWVCALHTESLKGDPFGRDRAKT